MAKAVYNGVVLAESDNYEVVEGNIYFPPESINRDHFQESTLTTVCPWKGTASYYDLVVNGETVQNAAWYYPVPKSAASNILNHVAFYRMVDVQK